MLTCIGTARNITGLVIDGIDDPIPTIEVVLICMKTFYGKDSGGQLAKGQEACDLRFSTSPNGLRHLAARMLEYANQAEDVFGVEPKEEDAPSDSGNNADSLPVVAEAIREGTE